MAEDEEPELRAAVICGGLKSESALGRGGAVAFGIGILEMVIIWGGY
jgi:hypothetical protein